MTTRRPRGHISQIICLFGDGAPWTPTRFDEASVDVDGNEQRLADLPLVGNYHHDGEEADDFSEWAVPVQWTRTIPREQGFWKTGTFPNQNSAAKLRQQFTIEQCWRRLRSRTETGSPPLSIEVDRHLRNRIRSWFGLHAEDLQADGDENQREGTHPVEPLQLVGRLHCRASTEATDQAAGLLRASSSNGSRVPANREDLGYLVLDLFGLPNKGA